MNGDFDIETAKYFRRASHKSKLDAAFGVEQKNFIKNSFPRHEIDQISHYSNQNKKHTHTNRRIDAQIQIYIHIYTISFSLRRSICMAWTHDSIFKYKNEEKKLMLTRLVAFAPNEIE